MSKDIQEDYSIAIKVTREAIEKKRQFIEASGYHSDALINEAGKHGDTFRNYERNAISYNGLLKIFNFLDGFDYAIRRGQDYKKRDQASGEEEAK